MPDERKPSEQLGGYPQEIAEYLSDIADATGGEVTQSAEKRPSDKLGGYPLEIADYLARTANGIESVISDTVPISPTGGIVSTQDGLAISPEQQSTGAIDGALLELTAKSKPATQATTTGKNLLNPSLYMDNKYQNTYDGDSRGIISSLDTTWVVGLQSISELTEYTLSRRPGSGLVVFYNTERSPIGQVVMPANTTTFTSIAGAAYVCFTYTKSSFPFGSDLQLELGSTATPYEPYTGGAPSPSPDYPQPIVTVRGRNLIDGYSMQEGISGTVVNTDTGFQFSTSSTGGGVFIDKMLLAGKSYVLTFDSNSAINNLRAYETKSAQGLLQISIQSGNAFTPTKDCYIRFWLDSSTNVTHIQLTEGSTPQPYVPYGHVGLERRDSQGTLLDTTPIPLPSRGWVAGLPDGTADELIMDGAGKIVWELETSEVVVNGGMTYFISGDGYTSVNSVLFAGDNVGVNSNRLNILLSHFRAGDTNDGRNPNRGYITEYGMRLVLVDDGTTFTDIATANTWLSTHPVTVLYPLATPVTETCGYIDLPDTQDCVLSIPELDALGVRYTIGDGAEIARQWYARAHSEYEQRITDLEEAVAELTAGA